MTAATPFDGDDTTMLWPGDSIGGYTIVENIGEGVSSRVYRVEKGGGSFALKVLTMRSPGLRARLQLEAKALAKLDHPHVVRGYGCVDERGMLALVMEYVPGPSLGQLLERGRLPVPAVQDLGAQLIDAVAAAHRAGLIHRDLKPTNLLIDERGGGRCLKVSDFGLVRNLSGDGSLGTTGLVGTPRYMAPETLRDDKRVDSRSDLFSVGVVLYEMACGQPPFQGDKLAVFNAGARGEYVRPRMRRPELPEAVERAIVSCLEPDPDHRVPDASTLLSLWRGDRDSWDQPAAAPMMERSETSAPAPMPVRTPSPSYPPQSAFQASLDNVPPPVFVPQKRRSSLGPSALLAVLTLMLILTSVGLVAWVATREPVVDRIVVPVPVPVTVPAAPVVVPAPPPAPVVVAPAAEPAPSAEAPTPAPPPRPAPRAVPRPKPTVAAAPAPAPAPAPTPEPAPPKLEKVSDIKSPWKGP